MNGEYNDEYDNEDAPDPNMVYDCPACNQELDEIDYEYQICHLCGWGRSKQLDNQR